MININSIIDIKNRNMRRFFVLNYIIQTLVDYTANIKVFLIYNLMFLFVYLYCHTYVEVPCIILKVMIN